MRYMALDIGDVRTGIAVSDAGGLVASPVKVLPTPEVMAHAATFRCVLEDYEPDALVCGLPLSLSGGESDQTRKVREMGERVAAQCGLKAIFVDERLSSSEAKRRLREEGFNEKKMRGKVDMVAASIFLQAFLDAENQ